MGLFNREAPELRAAREASEAKAKAELEESLASLSGGGLPLRAKRRLEEELRSPNFTMTGLRVNEDLLVRQAGYESLGPVMGSSFYKVSFFGQSLNWTRQTGELRALTEAQLAVRSLALARLREEARLLGAQGVVGVRLKIGRYDWSAGLIEFSALGTAVRATAGATVAEPFTSALSGQDFWKLRSIGYLPWGIAYGVCSYYIHSDKNTRALTTGLFGAFAANQEIPQYTEGLALARHLAMQRFKADALARSPAGASRATPPQEAGAVGVSIDWAAEDVEYEQNNTKYHDLLVHFTALGTVIAKGAEASATAAAKPPTTLSFHDLRSDTCRTISPPTRTED